MSGCFMLRCVNLRWLSHEIMSSREKCQDRANHMIENSQIGEIQKSQNSVFPTIQQFYDRKIPKSNL